MLRNRFLPHFYRDGFSIQSSTCTGSNNKDFHFDLLSFISIAVKLGVDLVAISWQPGLAVLGAGSTSTVSQAQVDANINLAFKRSVEWSPDESFSSEKQTSERFKALIFELVALELLRSHPSVINLVGSTWEVDAQTENVWPVLLSERSKYGSLTSYLCSEDVSFPTRLELCADIANACIAMHRLGIIHGDIKCENVLIFDGDGRITAKLIDFGYSCFGTSDDELVQVAHTKPWQAPEHGDQFFQFSHARRMDVYSFGMLLCRVFLSECLSDTVGKVGRCSTLEEYEVLLQRMQGLKSSPEFLQLVLAALESASFVPNNQRALLRHLLELSLQHNPMSRASDFSEIVSLLSSIRENGQPHLKIDSTKQPFDFAHEILNIQDVIGDLDNTDYLLHRAVAHDLRKRTQIEKCPLCMSRAAYQLGLCYAIGFGLKRDLKASSHWASTARIQDSALPDIHKCLSDMANNYKPGNPTRLFEVLGYRTSIPFDLVELYRVQGRLETAERMLQLEIEGREQAVVKQNYSQLSLMSILALVYAANNKLDQAESVCREAAASAKSAFGGDDPVTLEAQNYLAYILYRENKFDELQEMQLEIIETKKRVYGVNDGTTLNSLNYLGAVYYQQGRFDDSLKVMRELADIRIGLIGAEQPETLVTQTWITRALVKKGELAQAESHHRQVIAASERALGSDNVATLERKEVLAGILVDLGKLDEAEFLGREVLERCKKVMGSSEVVIARIKSTYARTKLAQGKLEEAKVIVGEAIDSGVAILGVDDPEVLKDYELLAVIIERLGELENAGEVQARALNGYCKHFGELHYQTLAARQNLERILAMCENRT